MIHRTDCPPTNRRSALLLIFLAVVFARPAVAAQTLYVVDINDASVKIFSTSASGNVAPNGTIKSISFGTLGPHYIALDASRNMWISDSTNNAIYEFPARTAGTPHTGAAAHMFVGLDTSLSSPHGIIFDTVGNLWGVNWTGNSIFEYSAAQIATLLAGGISDVAPAVTISGRRTRMNNAYGIAIDSTGRIVVTNQTVGGLINVYSAGSSGNAAPVFQITSTAIANGEYGLTLDSLGDYWVAAVPTTGNLGQILKFNPSSCSTGTCTLSPILSISGGTVVTPVGIAVDASGDIWAGNPAGNVKIKFVNQSAAFNNGGESCSGSITSGSYTSSAGNMLAIMIETQGTTSPTISGVTNSNGDKCPADASQEAGSSALRQAIHLCPNVTSGARTVTVNYTGGAGTCYVSGLITEFSGFPSAGAHFDQKATANFTSLLNTGATGTMQNSNELVLAMGQIYDAGGASFTDGPALGYVALNGDSLNSGKNKTANAYYIETANPKTTSTSWTVTATAGRASVFTLSPVPNISSYDSTTGALLSTISGDKTTLYAPHGLAFVPPTQ